LLLARSLIVFEEMAKSKNHTNHNQSVKNHKNGIRCAIPLYKNNSQRGSWLPALVNARRVRKANQSAAKAARRTRLAAFRATLKK
jgi:large subunit ribosomal protein L29e